TMKALIQGYYIGGGQMSPVLNNEGVSGASPSETDSIIVEAHATSNFNTLIDSYKGVIDVNGTVSGSLSLATAGQYYYMALRHRSGLLTTSADSVLLDPFTTVDWRLSASAVWGANQLDLGDGYFAIFSGDVSFPAPDEY